jgi:hypothetical protein
VWSDENTTPRDGLGCERHAALSLTPRSGKGGLEPCKHAPAINSTDMQVVFQGAIPHGVGGVSVNLTSHHSTTATSLGRVASRDMMCYRSVPGLAVEGR